MPDTKISALTELTIPAVGDWVPIVDVSDTTQAASGSTKKITKTNLFGGADLPNRNAIINGAMDIWQRGTATLTNPANATYLGDGTYDLLYSAETPSASFPFQSSMKLDCTHIETEVAAGEYVRLNYFVEGYDFKRFEGQTATLSFWVWAVKTGVYCVSLRNNANDKSYIHEFTINSASTWEKKIITLTFNSGGAFLYTNGVGLRIQWSIMTGSTWITATANKDTWLSGYYMSTDAQVNGLDNVANEFKLTGVQLEIGSVATPFEFRHFTQELALCQRYYERIFPNISQGIYAAGYAYSTTQGVCHLLYATKRTSPTFGFSAVNDFQVLHANQSIETTNMAANLTSVDRTNINANVAAGLTVGGGILLLNKTATSPYIEVISEL
jgi:hypothetical protein